jgi:hypothetical protein
MELYNADILGKDNGIGRQESIRNLDVGKTGEKVGKRKDQTKVLIGRLKSDN